MERLDAENPPWREAGKVFISSVTNLLERLLDYRNVMQGDENRDKRMSCTVNLLNFYKSEIDRKEMYLRYAMYLKYATTQQTFISYLFPNLLVEFASNIHQLYFFLYYANCFLFHRYIYKLYDLHLQAENYTEAGFTLKLYADMLSWSKETLTFAPNDTVGQLEWERKENLYKEVSFNFRFFQNS